jgi:hypothetical protein
MNINDIRTMIGIILMISAFIVFMSKVRINFSRLEELTELIDNIKSEKHIRVPHINIIDMNAHQSQLEEFQNEYNTTYMWPWFGLTCVFFTSGLCIIYI